MYCRKLYIEEEKSRINQLQDLGKVSIFNLCMLGNFSCFYVSSADFFFKINFFKRFFQEHYQSVKRFGSRSGLTLCLSWYGFKLFAKVISR